MGMIIALLFSNNQAKSEELRFTDINVTPDGKTVLELEADVSNRYARVHSTTNDLRDPNWKPIGVTAGTGYYFSFTNSSAAPWGFYKAELLPDGSTVEYYHDLPQYNNGKGRVKKITYADGSHTDFLEYWDDTNDAKRKKVYGTSDPLGSYQYYVYDPEGNVISSEFKTVFSDTDAARH